MMGDFADGLTGPILALPLMPTLLAVGLFGGQLGGRDAWRTPLAALIGLGLGAVAIAFVGTPPYADRVMPGALILLGLLILLRAPVPGLLAALVTILVTVYHGANIHALQTQPWLSWLGYAAGVVLMLAAGVGLAAMAIQAAPRTGIRLLGAAICALGGAIFVGIA